MAEIDKLELSGGIKAIAALLIIVGIFMGGLTLANKHRNQSIVDRYMEEAQPFIQANQTAWENLFTTTFDQAETCAAQSRHYPNNVQTCESTISAQIRFVGTESLKDYSSTAFLRLKNGHVQKLSLSGDLNINSVDSWDYSPSGSNRDNGKEEKVRDLLQGKISQLPWDNYTYGFPGKQVIIPIRVGDHILGALIRGVIE